ncbi:hypothetical protein WKW80_35670 [Variovorax humicola]|uniref:DUF1488 family protein n=1 Tax=Variovorax humicola TaxID=1769758 RepID=A0ABU8WB35_9BURK
MICEAVHCFDRATVRFAIYPDGLDGARILGEITEDALRDLFGARGGPDSLLEACERHFELIAAIALEQHRLKPRQSTKLETMDFANPISIAEPLSICAATLAER